MDDNTSNIYPSLMNMAEQNYQRQNIPPPVYGASAPMPEPSPGPMYPQQNFGNHRARPYSSRPSFLNSRPFQGNDQRQQLFPQRRTMYQGCHHCKSMEHYVRDCPTAPKLNNTTDRPRPRCTYCTRIGHIESECLTKQRARAMGPSATVSRPPPQ